MSSQNLSSPQAANPAIAFIDAAVADSDLLALGATPGVEVVLLDPNRDGMEQITQTLLGRSDVSSVQIFSHGEAGSLLLGSTRLDASTLGHYGQQLQQWRLSLTDSADILLFGCNIAADSFSSNGNASPSGVLDGISFVNRLSQLTGADVAASNNLTGAGGDWVLEVNTGAIESLPALRSEVMNSYQGTLNVITVTSAADSGPGSLRAALASAPAGSTIRFASTLAGRTITLTSGELRIARNVSIDGAGAPGITISGNRNSRVFLIEKNLTVALSNLRVINGRTTGVGGGVNLRDFSTLTVTNCQFNNNAAGIGGGIRVGYGARATVTNSSFDGNDGTLTGSGFSGGAIATNGAGGPNGRGSLTVRGSQFTNNRGVNGGAIYSLLGPLTVENSVFRNNRSAGDLGGGAIFTDGGDGVGPSTTVGGTIAVRGSWFEGNQTQGEGGALFLYGYGPDKIILEDSTVIGNTANTSARGVARGGGLRANRQVTIRNVTFANNTSAKQGGGIWVDGNLPINITNSTFSGNRAGLDAGGAMFLRTSGTTPVNIINTTIAGNSAGRASGAIWTGSSTQPVTLTNSIVANNTAGDPSQQQTGFQLRDGGGNIEFPPPAPGRRRVLANSLMTDPRLGALQNMGGDLVHPLLTGSSAINRGVRRTGVPTTDQRGLLRDTQVDVGAFELGARSSSSQLAPTRTASLTSSTDGQSSTLQAVTLQADLLLAPLSSETESLRTTTSPLSAETSVVTGANLGGDRTTSPIPPVVSQSSHTTGNLTVQGELVSRTPLDQPTLNMLVANRPTGLMHPIL